MAARSENPIAPEDLAAWTLQMVRMKRWSQECYAKLFPMVDSMTQKTFTEYIFLNAIRYYLIDVVNFPESSLDLYANLIYQLMEKTRLPATQIKGVIDRVNNKAQKSQLTKMPSIADLTVNDNNVTLAIEEFALQIPKAVYDHLLRINDSKQQLVSLTIRYELLGRDSSFFWSIDPELIRSIDGRLGRDRKIESLECFGSPWNFTLSNYCSPFEEDGVYGSKGDFFRYLSRSSGPMRFFLNPPFTERMIDRSIDAVLDYMVKNPGCDFIALLPSWPNSSSISRLDVHPDVQQIQLEKKNYVIFDHSSQSYIKPGVVNMIMYFSLADGPEKTTEMAAMAKKFLKIKARKMVRPRAESDSGSYSETQSDSEKSQSEDSGSEEDLTKLL